MLFQGRDLATRAARCRRRWLAALSIALHGAPVTEGRRQRQLASLPSLRAAEGETAEAGG